MAEQAFSEYLAGKAAIFCPYRMDTGLSLLDRPHEWQSNEERFATMVRKYACVRGLCLAWADRCTMTQHQ